MKGSAMVKRSNSTTVPVTTGGSLEEDIEARKAKMARIAEAERTAGNPFDAQSADTSSDDALNPFNPSSLRMDQSFTDIVEVKKLLTTVPVRKPHKQEFVRVRPDPLYRLTPAAIIEVKEDREIYLVTPKMTPVLVGEYSPVTLFTTINRRGTLFLWPVKLPPPDGRTNEWHKSAALGAERAMTEWVKVTANMSLGAYEIFKAAGDLPDPVWPDYSFQEILKIAFRDRLVDRPDHPLVQYLLGIG
jgi:hypothetical protein